MMFQFGMGRGPRPMFGGRFGNQGDTNVNDTLGPSFSMPGSATSPISEAPAQQWAPATFPTSSAPQANGDPYAANPAPSPFSSSLSAADAIPDAAPVQSSMGSLQGGSMYGAAQGQAQNAMARQQRPRFSFGGNGGGMRFGGQSDGMAGGGWGGHGMQGRPMMGGQMGGGMNQGFYQGQGGQSGWGGNNPRMQFGGGPKQQGRMSFGEY